MGLLRYRDTGRLLTEKEFRYETRKRRPHNVPAQGELTEAWLNGEGIDVVFDGPKPNHNSVEYLEDGGVEQINGKWFTKTNVLNRSTVGGALKIRNNLKYDD
jgi:hypothetical protein